MMQSNAKKEKRKLFLKGNAVNPICLVLAALAAALVSAFSVSVFWHMRDNAVRYYHDASLPFLRDVLMTRTSVLIAAFLLLAVWFFCVLWMIKRSSVSEWVVSCFFAFYIMVSLSMEGSELTRLTLPAPFLYTFVAWIGFALICFSVVSMIDHFLDQKVQRIVPRKKQSMRDCVIQNGLSVCVIILCWIPVILICYPGSVANDTRFQIMSWFGHYKISAAHPILTTVLYGSLYGAGLGMGSPEMGIFLSVLVQVLINGVMMGCSAAYVWRKTESWLWCVATLVFFGLTPVWQNAAQLVLKDVLHTGVFLLFYFQYLHCLKMEKNSKGRLWNAALLVVLGLLVAYTRHATSYLVLISMVALALFKGRKFLLPYLSSAVMMVALMMLIDNVVLPAAGVAPKWKSENYSLQFQQVALYCKTYNHEITQEEFEAINTTLDYDKIVENYTPMISDPVKSTFRDQVADHSAFWAMYRKMFMKHPTLFLKAIVMNSFEHLNPWFDGAALRIGISNEENFFPFEMSWQNFTGLFNNYWAYWKEIPVLRLLMGNGLYCWIILTLLAYAVKERAWRGVQALIPALVLLVGLFLTHVNGEIRYGYPLIAAVPLCFACVVDAVASSRREKSVLQQSVQKIEEK